MFHYIGLRHGRLLKAAQRRAEKNMYGTRLNTGDCMVAVQWYERLGESVAERREFVRGKRMIDVGGQQYRVALARFRDDQHRRFLRGDEQRRAKCARSESNMGAITRR